MRISKTIVGVVLGGFTAAGAVAHAQAQTVEFPQVESLYYGGACFGGIRSWADTSPDYKGRAVMNIQALPIQGVGPGEFPLAPLCDVQTTVAWRNVDTGAAGEYRVNVVSGIYGSIQYSLFQDTGPGHIAVTVSTNNASIPVQGAIDVPAPPPDDHTPPGTAV